MVDDATGLRTSCTSGHSMLWLCYLAFLVLVEPNDRVQFVHPSFCTALAPAELGNGGARGQLGLGQVCVVGHEVPNT